MGEQGDYRTNGLKPRRDGCSRAAPWLAMEFIVQVFNMLDEVKKSVYAFAPSNSLKSHSVGSDFMEKIKDGMRSEAFSHGDFEGSNTQRIARNDNQCNSVYSDFIRDSWVERISRSATNFAAMHTSQWGCLWPSITIATCA
jgi:hypothetical protein